MLRARLRGMAAPLVKGVVFTVVTVLATAVLAITIANRGSGESATYSAVFTNATSLNPGDDIRMAGVRIGQVESVEVFERRHAKVEFTVDTRRELYESTTAAIKFRNLIGQRYVSLSHGDGDSGETLDEGAMIPLDNTRPALDLTALFNGFKPLFQALSPKEMNKLSYEIVQVLQGEGGTVDSVLRHTASLTSSLADKDKVIGRVVTNLNSVLDEMNAKGDELAGLIETSRKLVSGLAADSEPIGDALSGMAELSTSTADLLRQGRDPLKKSIKSLDDLAGNLSDNDEVFEKFIGNLPRKYQAIGRTASYGSWLNFYLCAARSDAEQAPGGGPVGVPLVDARCKR